MGEKLIQPSFAGGELDPGLWGRVDLARYGICVRTGRNFIVKPAGGLVSRRGFGFVGEIDDSSKRSRFLRFEVSADIAYVAVLEEGKCQFIYRGAYVVDGSNNRVEIATPYLEADLPLVHITQSADTMFLVHPDYPPRRIARVSATEFETSELEFREGPFRAINSDESRQMWASAATGTITVQTNFDLFTTDMVGALVYLEQKALGTIKPWVQGERTPNLVLGTQRRSDGKVYTLTSIPTYVNWAETGNVRPTHETGREWDAPGDTRTTTGFSWTVGVEWEYAHSGYGIALITSYTNARSVTAVVKRTMPTGVVGGLGGPLNTWTGTGDGVTTAFSITGATQTSQSNYTVTVDGVPVESDPNYPGGGTGPQTHCVHVESHLPGGLRARDVLVDDTLMVVDPRTLVQNVGRVSFSACREDAELWRIVTESGISLVCSATAPIPTETGRYLTPAYLMGERVLVRKGGIAGWDNVVDCQRIGRGPVQHITCGNANFWAGETRDGYIAHHNIKSTDPY